MDELMNNKGIRCNFNDTDMKFFTPSKGRVKKSSGYVAKHTDAIVKPRKEKVKKEFHATRSFILWLLIGSIIVSGIGGILMGRAIAKEEYLEIRHWEESVIRSEAIADYKVQLEAEAAAEAEARMSEIKTEDARRREEIILFTKLFEGVRGWNFDMLDLITYGVCVWNRVQNPMFANSVDEVIHQKDQWVNYSDNNDVVADYHKVATKLVDLLYNSDVQLCSTKYCWIEIKDGHLYLKDSFNAYPGMILWRYNGEA